MLFMPFSAASEELSLSPEQPDASWDIEIAAPEDGEVSFDQESIGAILLDEAPVEEASAPEAGIDVDLAGEIDLVQDISSNESQASDAGEISNTYGFRLNEKVFLDAALRAAIGRLMGKNEGEVVSA